jgi:AraC-like DNA-binding protein
MQIIFDFNTVLYLASAAVGIVSGFIILYFGFKYKPANQPLGIAQLCLGLSIWGSFVVTSGLLVHLPFWYRVGNVFTMLFIPMSFLYVVFFTQRRSWKWYDLLHLIPVLIYIADYWEIFLMPAAEKKGLIQQGLSNLDGMMEFRDSKFFGPHFYWEFRTALFSFYWVAKVVVMVRWLRSQGSINPEIKIWRNWMISFLLCQFAMLIIHYVSLVTSIHFLVISGLFVALSMLITLVIFFYPSILYGLNLPEPLRLTPKINRRVLLTEEGKQKMENDILKMETLLERKKSFLIEGYSVHDFSKDINIPAYQISKILGTLKGFGFVDYINQKRIRYCTAKLDEGAWSTFTLEAISFECGFSNRNTFTQAFIKFQGYSPSMYRRRLKKFNQTGA